MGNAPEGAMWFEEHLVDARTGTEVAELFDAVDGTPVGNGLVRRIDEFATTVDGRVAFLGLDWRELRQAPAGSPLAHLEAASDVVVPERQTALVRMVQRRAPEDLEPQERMRSELLSDAGMDLLAIHWGEVARWVPAATVGGRAPAMTVHGGLLVLLAPIERAVPSVDDALGSLQRHGRLPGGTSGQRSRERGVDWPSVPRVADWSEPGADRWMLAGLVELLIETADAAPMGAAQLLLPSPTELVPGGAPVLLGRPWSPLIGRRDDGLLTLWEGRDRDGGLVAVACHRSAGPLPALPMPLWPDQRPASTPDGWYGELMEYEDEHGEVSRYRLRVTPVGRLELTSQRIVASDPCVAGRVPPLGITAPASGPFPVHRVDLLSVGEDGNESDDESRGILLVLDTEHGPVRWGSSTDDEGQPLECSIDTGLLLLGDARGVHAIQQGYDEGTIEYSVTARLALHRSDPGHPADVAILSDLGGDGPAWIVTGYAEDGHPVAVMVANFDPLS
jgi:hypothetical protein